MNKIDLSICLIAVRPLILIPLLGLSALSIHAEQQSPVASFSSNNALPEKALGRLCGPASSAYVSDFVENRDRGVPRQEALTSVENDWGRFRKRASLDWPLPSAPPLTNEQQAHLRNLAEKLSVLTYELPKTSSEILEIVATEQCNRGFRDQRQLTLNELRIRIYGAEVCSNKERHVRYSCLYSLFSAAQLPSVPVKITTRELIVTAVDVGLEEAFPSATISFVFDETFPLIKGYFFKMQLGKFSSSIKPGFDSAFSLLGSPYRLYGCSMRRLGQLIGSDLVLIRVNNQSVTDVSGLAIFANSEDSFASITSGPYGGEDLRLMSLNRLLTKCENGGPSSEPSKPNG
ncbi:MAG: hypothetical protein Q7T29_05580 [Gallionella sp.]|nr:hypothetical protein [Gallionella sp.]